MQIAALFDCAWLNESELQMPKFATNPTPLHLQADVHAAANARMLGSEQSDAIQNITGTIGDVFNASGTGSGALYLTNTGLGPTPLGGGSTYKVFNFDASRVARTSTENRSTNVACAPVINL